MLIVITNDYCILYIYIYILFINIITVVIYVLAMVFKAVRRSKALDHRLDA
jgi:hypothetical protein